MSSSNSSSAEELVVLTKDFDTSNFDCGKPYYNSYLQRHALKNMIKVGAYSYTKVLVNSSNNEIIGYFTTTSGDTLTRKQLGMSGPPGYGLPTGLIANIAVDVSYKGQGYSLRLIKESIDFIINEAQKYYCWAIVVDLDEDSLEALYKKFGFQVIAGWNGHRTRMFLLVEDYKQALLSAE